MNTKEHPGIYLPPPVIYIAFFALSILLQELIPLNRLWLRTPAMHVIGWLLVALYFVFAFCAIRQFIISKNTIVTIKPATSLQTTGIYAFTRNPMYLSLVLLYSGIGILYGNYWTFFLLPLLIVVVELYVIQKEEKYLRKAFGEQYDAYRKKVRRWI